MITTIELIEAVKKKQGIESKYALAKTIGCTRRAVNKWLDGEVLSERRALQFADLADLDPGYVLFSIVAERAKKKGETRLFEYWKKRADDIGPTFLSASIGILAFFAALPLPL